VKKWLGLLLLPMSLCAVEVQPWFGNVYEFHFLGAYSYSRFNQVEGAVPQLTNHFQASVVYLGLDLAVSPQWSFDADFQLADTTAQSFNVRSTAAQARYLWLDDITGDPVTLTTGFNIRYTPDHALHDVSCPSHSNADFELNGSVGKEFGMNETCLLRTWAFASVGHGIVGSPWVRGMLAVETNINDQHRVGLFAEGISGYGSKTHIDPNHFDGYAKVRNKAIDLSVRYGVRTGVWGTLRFEYTRRVLARVCPENVNTWTISYLLPFSL